MKTVSGEKKKNILFSVVLALEICFFVFLSVRLNKTEYEIVFLSVLFVLITAAVYVFLFYRKTELTAKQFFLTPAVVLIVFCLTVANVFFIGSLGRATGTDDGKEMFFADKKVMIIVPHQDDEVLLCGGVIENYINYGSEVYIVFVTAGDYYDAAERRMKEAISVADCFGIKEENVIFLGYGDDWKADYHIYNAYENELMVSYNGNTKTFGLKEHPAFSEGHDYTRKNLKSDLKAAVKKCNPDVIYCTDYDKHVDHRAVSLFFDEVMGEILKQDKDYKPQVYKGFSYSCCLNSFGDYSLINNASTRNPYETVNMKENNIYNWNERVRVPVAYSAVSGEIENTSCFRAFSLYTSQELNPNLYAVVNSDHVYWERNVKSLVYCAKVEASSGDCCCLNDFKLYDSENIRDLTTPPSGGVWVPDSADRLKTVTFTLTEPADISSLILYDNPSSEDNVVKVDIRFNNKEDERYSDIFITGAVTKIPVHIKNVESFSVTVRDSEGDFAGFTEIEALPENTCSSAGLIKTVSDTGDFVYDYCFLNDEKKMFSLYVYNQPQLSSENYEIVSENKKIKAEIKNDKIEIDCPENRSGKITIKSKDGKYSDTFWVYGKKKVFVHIVSLDVENWKNRVSDRKK